MVSHYVAIGRGQGAKNYSTISQPFGYVEIIRRRAKHISYSGGSSANSFLFFTHDQDGTVRMPDNGSGHTAY